MTLFDSAIFVDRASHCENCISSRESCCGSISDAMDMDVTEEYVARGLGLGLGFGGDEEGVSDAAAAAIDAMLEEVVV